MYIVGQSGKMIKALFKYDYKNQIGTVIDTTSGRGDYNKLSPFILEVIDPMTQHLVLFENLWQFSKVYKSQLDKNGNPSESWYYWRRGGVMDDKAHRYPMGKGAIPEYSYLNGEKLGYIEARKKIYAPIYAHHVKPTASFESLKSLYDTGRDITLLDYDAYDHAQLGMSLIDVINNPKRKMGHAFVLIMMLEGILDECLKTDSSQPFNIHVRCLQGAGIVC